jgi:cell wall assembly regulator SMI1
MLIPRRTERTPASVSSSWQRLERWLGKHFPRGLLALRSGASEAQLKKLEQVLGQTLPQDMRASWALHDGEEPGVWEGVIFRCRLISVQGIETVWRHLQSVLPMQEAHPDRFGLDECTSFPKGAIQCVNYTRGWIPLHDWDGRHFGVDLNPAPHGVRGQVINFGLGHSAKYVLARSWGHFLEDVADELEAGNFVLEVDKDGGIATYCPAAPACPYDHFPNGFREWAEAKLPEEFRNSQFPAEAEEHAASPQQKAACIQVVQDFLDAMYRWETEWLARRPLQPLGLVRLEELRGKLTSVCFDPEKGPIHSGVPEHIFDPKFSDALANLTARVSNVFGANPNAANAMRMLERARELHANLPQKLSEHPLAEIYRSPQRHREFFQDGRTYDEAMAQKRQIVRIFAPKIEVPELFVQTDPPTYEPRENTIGNVLANSATHCIVYLKPRRAAQSGSDIGVCIARREMPTMQTIRYHLGQLDSNWFIQSREASFDGGPYLKLSF